MRISKAFSIITIILITALVLTSCSRSGSEKGGKTGKPAAPSIAFYAYNSEPILDWDPAVMFSNGIVVLHNVYETLLRYDAVNDELVPLLAESWEVSEDALTWTFKIRRGVTFHDGTALNAEAVKYSIDRTIRKQMGASYIWSAVTEIKAVDDYTVEFNLEYPAPIDLIASTSYAAFIYSPTSVTSDDSAWFADGNECGTGPYMLQSQVSGDEVVLTRYEDYWKGWDGKHFDKVVFKKISETSSRRQMIEKGAADVATNLPSEDIEAMKKNDRVTIFEEKSYINAASYFNTKRAPLDNKLVRQALSYAFPYENVIRYALGGLGTQSRGPVAVGLWGHGDSLHQYSYDLNKAKSLMREAGYEGKTFDLLYTYTAGEEDQKKVAELYKAELAKLGVNLEIRSMPWDSQWEMAKGPEEGRQDITAMYWWPDYPSPVSWMYNLFITEEEPFFNLSYYSRPEVDDLVFAADETSAVDIDKAAEIFVEAQKMVVDDAPAVFQYDKINAWALNTTFKGHVPNPAYSNVVFFYDTYRE